MDIAIISDTHVPSRAAEIPDWVLEHVRAADHTIHAGDFDSPGALADIRAAATRLTAVSGNMDPISLGLSDVTSVTLGGVEFVVAHGTGSAVGYDERVAGIVKDHATETPVVGIAGHTHMVLDTTVRDVRLLNPGSATGAAPAHEATMLTATAAEGDLSVTVRRPD